MNERQCPYSFSTLLILIARLHSIRNKCLRIIIIKKLFEIQTNSHTQHTSELILTRKDRAQILQGRHNNAEADVQYCIEDGC